MTEFSRRGVLTAAGSAVVSGCARLRHRKERSVQNQLPAEETTRRTEQRSSSTVSGDVDDGPPRTVASVDRTVRVPPGDGWGYRFTTERRATLSYTVRATKPGKSGFDVFLFTGNEYTDYRHALNGRLVDAQPTGEASARNVEERVTRTCTLSPETYVFVVDNSPFGDGGKPRSKRPEEVDVSLTVRPRPD